MVLLHYHHQPAGLWISTSSIYQLSITITYRPISFWLTGLAVIQTFQRYRVAIFIAFWKMKIASHGIYFTGNIEWTNNQWTRPCNPSKISYKRFKLKWIFTIKKYGWWFLTHNKFKCKNMICVLETGNRGKMLQMTPI